MLQPSTALAQVTSASPTPLDVYAEFYGVYAEPAGWAAPNVDVRGDDTVSPVDMLERQLGHYVDRIHELPDDVKFATGSMPMAPDPRPFVLGPQASGSR